MYKRSDYVEVASQYARIAATRTHTNLHIAFVYGRGGVLLGMATNRVGSRSRGAGFSNATIHAERAALKAIGNISLLRGAVLVVVRVDTLGTLRNSKPCHECQRHLQKAMKCYGLRRVYYS